MSLLDPLHTQKAFWNLFLGRMLLSMPSNLVGLFLPIFLYTLFNEQVYLMLLYFLAGHLLYVVFLPFGAQSLNHLGFRKALMLSTFWNALLYGAWLVLSYTGLPSFWVGTLVAGSLVCLVLFRLLFWLPYHVEVAKLTEGRNRGTSVSLILVMIMAAGVVGPLLGGYIIQYFGFSAVFVTIALISLFACIPLWRLPKANERFEWAYRETWRQLFQKRYRKMVLAMLAKGAENVIGITVWPIFIFLLLEGNYLAVGVVSSVIVVVTMGLQYGTGKYLDRVTGRSGMLRLGSVFVALGWVAKIFVVTAFHIFVAGVYHNITKVFTETPLDTLYYDLAADSGHYIDELSVLREMGIQLGKVVALVFVIALSFVVAIQWTFLIAAGAALALNMLFVQKRAST